MDNDQYRGSRVSTSDSVLSESTAASRESLVSISNKLANMELELDQTLRDLDTTQNRSKSPSSTSKRYPLKQTSLSHSNVRTRSGSIDPLASSRRSGSIDPSAQNEAHVARIRELTERMEALEKENHLLETKYDQQRKRLNLSKRENEDLRSTLDSAITEIEKLGEEAHAAHQRSDGKSDGEYQTTIHELQQALSDAHAEITELRILKAKAKSTSNKQLATLEASQTVLALEDSLAQLKQQAAQVSEEMCSLTLTVNTIRNLELLGIDSVYDQDVSILMSYGEQSHRLSSIIDLDAEENSEESGVTALFNSTKMFALIHDRGDTPIKLTLQYNEESIAHTTLQLPDLNSNEMNVCLELEEWLPFTSNMSQEVSPSTSITSAKRASVQIVMSCLNFKNISRSFAELDAYRTGLNSIAEAAKTESTARGGVDIISHAITGMLAELEDSRRSSSRSHQGVSTERELTIGDGDLSTDLQDFSMTSPTKSSVETTNTASLNLFQGEVPSTPQVVAGSSPSPHDVSSLSTASVDVANSLSRHNQVDLRETTIVEEQSLSDGSINLEYSSSVNSKTSSKASPGGVATTATKTTSSSSSSSSLSSAVPLSNELPEDATLLDKFKKMAEEQPLQAFLIVVLGVLLCWCAASNTLHNAHIARIESNNAVFKHDYLAISNELGIDSRVPTKGLLFEKVHNISAGYTNCSSTLITYGDIQGKYNKCSRDLKNERQVTEQLLSELHARGGGEDLEGNSGEEKKSGWFFNKFKSNDTPNGENEDSDDESYSVGSDSDEDYDEARAIASSKGGSSAQTIAALYRCRRENREESQLRVDAVIKAESAEQDYHQCQQEVARLGTAHESAVNERATCEEGLLKQEAWSASLTATNKVLHNHLRDAKNDLSNAQSDYATTKEEASKCEATVKTISKARNIAMSKISELELLNAKLENTTATLNATSNVLEKQLTLATSANEQLTDTTEKLTAELEIIRKNHDILSKDKSDLLAKLALIEVKAKELDQNLRAGESKYRAMAILEASQHAGRALLEKKINDVSQQASSAAGDKDQLALKNSELASQLALAEKSKAALKKELDLKMARLLELEQAMAALNAAEHVVTTESMVSDDKTISTCTSSSSGKSGGLCLTMQSNGGAAGAAANAAHRAANVAASIARSAGINNAWTEQHEHHDQEAPGLVAIAGAVAAVWVFAVIMEKRSSLYKNK